MTPEQKDFLDHIAGIVRVSVESGVAAGNERAEVAIESLNEDRNEIERITKERDELFLENGALANTLAADNLRLRAAIKGAEIALARDSDIDGAMRCLLSVTRNEPPMSGREKASIGFNQQRKQQE